METVSLAWTLCPQVRPKRGALAPDAPGAHRWAGFAVAMVTASVALGFVQVFWGLEGIVAEGGALHRAGGGGAADGVEGFS